MSKPRKEWEDVLFYIAPQVNSWIIEYLGYSFVKIIIEIQLLTSIECKIWINSLSTQLRIQIEN